ncbi:MAG: hypothetical protein ABMA64_09860 [Myxococcota bacterium]
MTEGTSEPPLAPGEASPPPFGFTAVLWVGAFSVVLWVMMRWFGRHTPSE